MTGIQSLAEEKDISSNLCAQTNYEAYAVISTLPDAY
jgi:hypothetical protein